MCTLNLHAFWPSLSTLNLFQGLGENYFKNDCPPQEICSSSGATLVSWSDLCYLGCYLFPQHHSKMLFVKVHLFLTLRQKLWPHRFNNRHIQIWHKIWVRFLLYFFFFRSWTLFTKWFSFVIEICSFGKALAFSKCLHSELFLLERQTSHGWSGVLWDFEGYGFLPCHTAAQSMSDFNLTFPLLALEGEMCYRNKKLDM